MARWIEQNKGHDAIIAWALSDEPGLSDEVENPEKTMRVYQAVKRADPGTLVTTVCNPLGDYQPFARWVDVFTVDWYFVDRDDGAFEPAMHEVVEKSQACARAAQVAGRDGYYLVTQAMHQPAEWRAPTRAEMRYIVWGPIVHGSQGIAFWSWGYAPPRFRKQIAHPVMREVADLQHVLVLPPGNVTATSSHDLDTSHTPTRNLRDLALMVRQSEGAVYVFAVNNTAGDFEATITLQGRVVAQATVLFEDRSLPIAGGRFRDAFGPYDVHIYRIAPAGPGR